jgi:hypothetical protein
MIKLKLQNIFLNEKYFACCLLLMLKKKKTDSDGGWFRYWLLGDVIQSRV